MVYTPIGTFRLVILYYRKAIIAIKMKNTPEDAEIDPLQLNRNAGNYSKINSEIVHSAELECAPTHRS